MTAQVSRLDADVERKVQRHLPRCRHAHIVPNAPVTIQVLSEGAERTLDPEPEAHPVPETGERALLHGRYLVRNALGDITDPFEARAAELLFRSQRVSRTDGRVLCADRLVVDMLNETAGFGDLGRLLVQGNAPVRTVAMNVLTPENASTFWRDSDRHHTLLDLTHELTTDLGHGLQFTMARTHSGLSALARVLRAWLAHLLGVRMVITPLRRIDDNAWRWHIGLEAVSMALLNDLYEDRHVEPSRLEDLVSLFRLDFEDPGDVLPEMAGKPVYLGLAAAPDGTLKVKPQNLLLNLPLSRAM